MQDERAHTKNVSYLWSKRTFARFLTFLGSIQFLRDVHHTFGTSFKIVPCEPQNPESSELFFSCYGTGYVNSNRSLA